MRTNRLLLNDFEIGSRLAVERDIGINEMTEKFFSLEGGEEAATARAGNGTVDGFAKAKNLLPLLVS